MSAAPRASVRFVLVATALAGALGAACTSSATPSSAGPTPTSTSTLYDGLHREDATVTTVTRVVDGDTFHATVDGQDERIRLIGVDTPEVDWYGGHAECFGSEAGVYARRRLTGRTVVLRYDVALRDPYGRLLAYVYLGHELFNLTLVRLGYARADPVAPDVRLQSVFAAAQLQARAAGAGLWTACTASASP